jgi:hypothetical protein
VAFAQSNPQLTGISWSSDAKIGAQNYRTLRFSGTTTKNFTIRADCQQHLRPGSTSCIVHGQRQG